MTEKINIREIARQAGVSTATVSRTINRVPTVDPQLAKRIWKVINTLGYYPNTQARTLVSGRSRIFGLVVSEITNPFFSEIVEVFENLAVKHGYEILTVSTVHDPGLMEKSVRRMVERCVDGVAVMTFGMEDLLLQNPKFRDVPLVFIDVGPDRPRVGNIRIDYLNGIRQAVQHLAALRHQRIAFISGPLKLKSAEARRQAYETSMQEIGLEILPGYLIEGDHTIEGGIRAATELLQLINRPTAIICSNDMTAIGVMNDCSRKKIIIPGELSLVGFDDIRFARFMPPPLTTVRMSQSELAKLAFHLLLDSLQKTAPVQHSMECGLQTQLVIRDSTTFAPRSTVFANQSQSELAQHS